MRLCYGRTAALRPGRTLVWHLPSAKHVRPTQGSCICPVLVQKMTSQGTATMALSHPGLDFTDVTKHTFRQTLPHIKQAIQDCAFYAFDLEMTGLFLDHHKEDYFDEPQDRYTRVREAAHAYAITQFGLSCFQRADDGFVATTFNAYLYPAPLPPEAGFMQPKRFLVDASSATFLSDHQFDFNKWIKDGVTYLPVRVHDEKIQQLSRGQQQENGNGLSSRQPVTITKPEDQQLVTKLVEQVSSWLAGDDPEFELSWLVNGYHRMLAYQELERPRDWSQSGAPLDNDTTQTDPGFYSRKIYVDGWPRIVLVRGNAAAAALDEAAQQAARAAVVVEAGGFADVIRAIKDSGKPAVGHNCFFDVTYILSSLAHGAPLPPVWSDFKSLASTWFPGGVYDTKMMARTLPPSWLPNGTALGDVFRALSTEGPSRDLAMKTMTDVGLTLPKIIHAPGSQGYAGLSAATKAHEAGYDAYMTGSIFAMMESLIPALAGQAITSQISNGLDATVLPFMGKLNMARTDMPHLALMGPDPPLARTNILYVKGSYGTRIPELLTILSKAGVEGKPRVFAGYQGGFLVALDTNLGQASWDAARLSAALNTLKAPATPTEPWVVRSWAEYAASKQENFMESLAAGGSGSKRRRVEPTPPAAPEQTAQAQLMEAATRPSSTSRCTIS